MIPKFTLILIFTCYLCSCNNKKNNKSSLKKEKVKITILGSIQDGGSPHIGCVNKCCNHLTELEKYNRKVVCIAIDDLEEDKSFLIEATPDIAFQLKNLKTKVKKNNKHKIDGILLTHAHIEHYSGLMFLGKEAMNTNKIKVFALPRMKNFIETNGPWSQLCSIQNIVISKLKFDSAISLSKNITITPIQVPHRDEYSETAGFIIEGINKKLLFIPDIDKWEKWNLDIKEIVKNVDYAFIDGTFYSENELKNRKMNEIPHPLVTESINLFSKLPDKEKKKIHFIHFNHSNPLLDTKSVEYKNVVSKGYNISKIFSEYYL